MSRFYCFHFFWAHNQLAVFRSLLSCRPGTLASWSALDEKTNEYVEQDIRTLSITAGANYKFLGPLYVEGRTGYYFSDMNEVVLLPI
mgnify:CR=1 FL=1